MKQPSFPTKPFVGLRPFESRESVLFFGRDEQINEVLSKLQKTRFVAVVGNSGCGKSSLIRAGVIPKLQAGFLAARRDRWLIGIMKPGSTPLKNLAAALLAATGEEKADVSQSHIDELTTHIRQKKLEAVKEQLSHCFQKNDTNLLLLVDQFEEIFRYSMKGGDRVLRKEAAAFVSLLLQLTEQDGLPVYVVLTMRSDFIGDCDAFRGLPRALNQSQYLVPRLTRSQYKEAIMGPVQLFHKGISFGLVNRILNEEFDQADPLPVIQHVLLRSWDAMCTAWDNTLEVRHYEQVGTVLAALSLDADAAMDGMDDRQREVTKRVFKCLADLDSGNRLVRKPACLADIVAITGAARDEVLAILQRFKADGRSFVIIPEDLNQGMIDISHESFIRQWRRMREWIEAEVEDKKRWLRLAAAREDFDNKQGGYLHDPQLQLMLDWFEERKPTPVWAGRYCGKMDKKERQAWFDDIKGFLLKSRDTRDRKKQRNRIRTILVISVLSVISIIALVAAIIAGQQIKIADANLLQANYNLASVYRDRATNYFKEAQNNLKPEDYQKSFLYFAAALKQKIPADKVLEFDSGFMENFLMRGMVKRGFDKKWFSATKDYHSDSVWSVSFSPDGKTLAYGLYDSTIILWDLTLYNLFLTDNNKPTPLFLAFADGAEFFWGKRVEGLDIVSTRIPNLYGQDGYFFTFDPKYSPLLDPPAPDQDKFDQILEWAKQQVGE